MKKSRFYTGILATIIASSLTGCAKKVDCDIPSEHIHLYTNEKGLNKLILGENENVGSYYWTERYVSEADNNKLIAKEGFLSTKDNIEYVLDSLENMPEGYRKELVHEYVYGPHYGYGYCYHWNGDKYEYGYGYGTITDYHWEDNWKKIDKKYYTSNKVKDFNYVLKLYKLNENGEFEFSYFSSFD